MPRGTNTQAQGQETMSNVSHNIYTNFQTDTGDTRLQSCPGEKQNEDKCEGGTLVVL